MSAVKKLPAWTVECLRCPRTGAELKRVDGQRYASAADGYLYGELQGRPRLMVAEFLQTDGGETTSAGKNASNRLLKRIDRLPWPSPDLNLVSGRNYKALTGLLEDVHSTTEPARVLIIGGGVLGDGNNILLESERVEAVETDVYPGDRGQLLCDAHQLPFADASFDAVVAQAVLEHVVDPPRVASEIHRVLRPDGLVYSEIPFMQQVHEGPYDFTRYTELGHRRLFRKFDEIDRGPVGGPGMAVAWSFRYLARSLTRRPGLATAILGRIAVLLTGWVKHIDRLILANPGVRDAASGTYFLGRRRQDAIDDRALIADYRGAVPVPFRTGTSPS